jgi:anti-sigma regulatory factor (Ser/Thr protein kinase)
MGGNETLALTGTNQLDEALQRSLLPAVLPEMPGVELVGRYRPGRSRIGGDWYDAFAMPDGRLMLSVGDVVGHGAPAASEMGRLRAALQVYAFESFAPRQMLEGLNRHAFEIGSGELATLMVLVVDPILGTAQYAAAGHPPPVLRNTCGDAHLLGSPGGPPVGATPRAHFVQDELVIPPGSTLVLYTDGLVERRGEDLGAGLTRLLHAVEAGPAAADDLADCLLGSCQPGTVDDDIAVLVAAWSCDFEPLRMRLPARPRALRRMRHALAHWLARSGVGEPVASNLLLAANEAVANAIEHAYGLGDGDVTMSVERVDDAVYVRVCDRGRWRATRAVGGGLGMELMHRLVDRVDIDAAPSGTTVHLRSTIAATTSEVRT